ncbi:hypothetical protein HPT25_11310 [Bacillus sp. BRMEA1]|nr:hypothetical protein [Neobacillus endophyticus]
MGEAAHDHFTLNKFHDEIMKLTIKKALEIITNQLGPLPCSFCFFVMGSAGRMEQSLWSDQDHGIVYREKNDEVKNYFWQLGKEISRGLFDAGYQYCDGGVMASNLLWCKSLEEWQIQISNWLDESNWESIRYLMIFMDARPLFGEELYVQMLKEQIYYIQNKSVQMTKFLNNSLYMKKGINVLGKLLTETHGPYTGSLNIKEIGLFPYVNAARLLALKENHQEPSTVARIGGASEAILPSRLKDLYQHQFIQLLNYRLSYAQHSNYHTGHYLPINKLTKEEMKEFKDIIRNGTALFNTVRKLIEKEDSYGN